MTKLMTLAELIRRPELSYEVLEPIDKRRNIVQKCAEKYPENVDKLCQEVVEQVNINIKYDGYTTEEAMRSGVLYGHASMVDGMLERIEESIGQSVTTVATGGNAPRILRYCKRPIQYDADLIMTGLYLL